MAEAKWIDADNGEDAPEEELKPKPRRKTKTQEQTEAAHEQALVTREQKKEDGTYVSPTREAPPPEEETYPPMEEPPPFIDDDAALAVMEAASELFSEDMSPAERARLETEIENERQLRELGQVQDEISRLTDPGLVGKLVKVMAAINGVEKRGRNEAMRYDYQRATDVTIEVRREFIAQGLSFSMSTKNLRTTVVNLGNSSQLLAELDAEFQISDGREVLTFTGVGAGMDRGDKGVYKAITGALKYGLRTLLLIPDEKMDPEVEREDERGQPQGGPIQITSSNVQGVQQGGRQTSATKPQLDKIMECANILMLTPEALEAYIVSTLGSGPNIDPSLPPAAAVDAIRTHLAGLSFEDAGKVVRGLVGAVDADKANPNDGGA